MSYRVVYWIAEDLSSSERLVTSKHVLVDSISEDQEDLGTRVATALQEQFPSVVKSELVVYGAPGNIQWAVFVRIEPTPGWRYEGMCFDEYSLANIVRGIEHDIRRGQEREQPKAGTVLPGHATRRVVAYKLVALENPCVPR